MDKIQHGQPIPSKIWTKAIGVLTEYVTCGERFLNAGKPKDGPLFGEYIKIEEAYNKMANAIWFADWTQDQRDEWSRIYNRVASLNESEAND